MNNILDLLITEASTIEYIDRRYLEESNKVLMGFRIKPHQNIDETFKKHSYQGYLDFIKNKADLSDIDYLRKDYQQGLATFKRIKERIEKVEKLGNCPETSGYYKGIKSKYIDKDITSKDVEATIKWYTDNIPKVLNDRKKALSESATSNNPNYYHTQSEVKGEIDGKRKAFVSDAEYVEVLRDKEKEEKEQEEK